MHSRISENAGLSLDGIDAAVIRTTIYICFQSGTYLVNDVIRADINKYFDRDRKLNHAGNVTLPLLDELLAGRDIPIYLVDPISWTNSRTWPASQAIPWFAASACSMY